MTGVLADAASFDRLCGIIVEAGLDENYMDKGLADDLNTRFAVYDALGRIPGMKSLVCLADRLHEMVRTYRKP
jgi:hypothetical protein